MEQNILKRVGLFLLLILSIVALLSGCTWNPLNGQTTGATKVVRDGYGQDISVPVKPKRIVSIGVSTDDILLKLVDTNQIVALSKLPPNLEAEAAKVEGRVEYTAESILSFHPDLVIIPSWADQNLVTQLRNMKIPVYVYIYPSSIDKTKLLIAELASLVDEKKRGDELITDINERMGTLSSFVTQRGQQTPKRAVFINTVGLAGGKESSFDSFCQYTGLENGARVIDLPKGSHASLEKLLIINPDIIFIPTDDYATHKGTVPRADKLYNDPALQAVKAIQNKQVYVVDARWIMSYSQFMVNAMEEMAKDASGYEKEAK